MSTKTPWIILLCKFKDDTSADPNTPEYYAALFTAPDIENVVTYWRDISYGELDLTGSEVRGWLRLDKNRADYTGSGADQKGRRDLVDWAKKAATDSGATLDNYYGIIVYVSVDTDLFGNADRYAVCDVTHSLSQILQEVGHGYGLEHSKSVAIPVPYENPFCVMSGLTFGGHLPNPSDPPNFFRHPTFVGRFGESGPGLCSPLVFKAGWLAESRIVRIATNGRHPASTILTLSPLGEMSPVHPEVAMFGLNTPQEVTYFVEYRSGGWDRGLQQDAVVIHQLRPDGFAYYAGSLATSIGSGAGGNTLLPGKSYADSQYDLSVEVLAIFDGAVKIRIAPAAAIGTLSVRSIAKSKLGLTNGFAVRNQVLQNATASLRDRLLDLLGQ